jgi:predicted MFS family arabinose efflux permease
VVSRIGGAEAWWIWTLAVTFVVYLFSFQTGYAIVNGSVQSDLGLTVAQIGTIAAVYTWAFAIFQLFGGALLDRLGARKVLPLSIALVTVGVLIFARAQSYETLLLSQLVLALGSCTGFVGAGYVGGQWFGMAKFSFMFGLVQFVAAITSAFTQNLIDSALQYVDWRGLFMWVAAFGVLLFVLGATFIKDPRPIEAAHEGIGPFFGSVVGGIGEVAKIPHVWIASLQGAALFGTMLALGVVYGPKLLSIRGAGESTAAMAASMLWLGLAVGSIVVVKWSDMIQSRRTPILAGTAVQLAALAALLYAPGGTGIGMALCFVFGFANAAHMLSFSTAADVVTSRHIGTSAAIVNGLMFVLGGIMIERPASRVGRAVEAGLDPGTMELARNAALPLLIALVVALVLAFAMKETYPRSQRA